MALTGHTRVAGVIGDPVRHSLSPVIHNAAFEACGLDWVYVAFPVPAGRGPAALDAMRVLGVAGLSVTMPHKETAAGACDALTPRAERLASVNTVVRRDDGSLLGDSTDGEGLLRSLGDAGIEVEGRSVLVLGARGAGRSVALALADAGATVRVVARRPEAARDAAAVVGAEVGEWAALAAGVGGAEVIVNATPIGMEGEPLPFDTGVLTSDHVVVDLVYWPAETPLLESAAERGARVVGGVGMLVHQAALAFEQWTGTGAPFDAMLEAAESALRVPPK